MALFPCDFCGARYSGKQQTAYPAFVQGGTTFSEKRRLCPADFEHLLRIPWLEDVTGLDYQQSTNCTSCGSAAAHTRVFVPYYAIGQERQDLYGQLCDACLTSGLQAVWGTVQPAGSPFTG